MGHPPAAFRRHPPLAEEQQGAGHPASVQSGLVELTTAQRRTTLANMAGQQKNVFWIGANILCDMRTGETKQVLMLVYREEDASTFSQEDAFSYKSLFESRAAQFAKIDWSVHKATTRPGVFVIRGEQYV